MNPETIEWDAVVVGTGMGGCTIGHALAIAGWRVLFIERGLDVRSGNSDAIYSRLVEDNPDFRNLSTTRQQQSFARGGRSSDEISSYNSAREIPFSPYIGCGTGGSSALYGAVLERLFPADFASGATYRDRGGSLLPGEWPITYEDLQPWYESAERLYRVRGTVDPLRAGEPQAALLPLPPLSPSHADLFQKLSLQGVHPYRPHVACERVAGCNSCQGHLCGSGCKNDAARICLTPALETHGAHLLTECAATFVSADRSKVTGLSCLWQGQKIELRSKIFILAAGALMTPVLLLNSRSESWPDGLANVSGTVGRTLMRHSIDLYVLTKTPRLEEGEGTKEVAFNDFYVTGSDKLGTVQSFGVASPLGYLQNRRGFNIWRLLGPLAPYLWSRHSRSPILASILEDLPSLDNRVRPDSRIGQDGRYQLSLDYRLNESDQIRRERFRKILGRTLKPFSPIRVFGTDDRPALGHVCGTCRFGDDPTTSVLDPFNRAHGLSNLYVVDGSFFPSSGGLNPALTIAANALRVAHHLASTTPIR